MCVQYIGGCSVHRGDTMSYIFSLQEQEVNTRMAQKQREKDPVKKRNIITKCHLCHQHNEDFFHILSSCTSVSDNMYLYQRHDRVAKIVYEEIIYKGTDAENKRKHITKPPKVTRLKGKEIWLNITAQISQFGTTMQKFIP